MLPKHSYQMFQKLIFPGESFRWAAMKMGKQEQREYGQMKREYYFAFVAMDFTVI